MIITNKTMEFLIIFIFVLLIKNIASAEESVEGMNVVDSTDFGIEIDTIKRVTGYYLISGIGISGGPSISSMKYPFNSSPAINLGIELPITYDHLFSLELKGFCWVGKSKYKLKNDDQSYFINLSNDFYSLMWLSGLLKCYFLGNNDRFRISFHLGYLFLCSNKRISGIDFGLGANYTIDELNYINITFSGCIDRLPGSPFTPGYLPSIFMLNFCHNFKW